MHVRGKLILKFSFKNQKKNIVLTNKSDFDLKSINHTALLSHVKKETTIYVPNYHVFYIRVTVVTQTTCKTLRQNFQLV